VDINNLIAFIEVAEKKSFSRSAESLNLTQPAVSKRVAALESELSAKLFDRVGRSIHLTEAGRILLPCARQISSELARIENVISNLGDEVGGTLSVGTTEYIGTHRLPAVLKTFHTKFPTVELDLHFANSEQTLSALISGATELALCCLTARELSKLGPKISCRQIWKNNLAIVAAHDHPLNSEDAVSLKMLSDTPAILPPSSAVTRKLIDEVFDQHKLRPKVSMEVGDSMTVRSMASIGIGWACLPDWQVDDTVSVIKTDELQLNQVINLIYHSDRTLSNSVNAFIDLLTDNKGSDSTKNIKSIKEKSRTPETS